MKQVFTKNGVIILEDMPIPKVLKNTVLVKTSYSLISTGTETGVVKGTPTPSLPMKILKKPKLILNGLKSLKENGVKKTLEIATAKTDSVIALGYSASGIVAEVGSDINDIKVGDRVSCAGAGLANHAEYLNIPRHLLAKIPDNVSLRDASSVTLGTIALQGVRQAQPKIGETIAVIGLGLLGQITIQILKANGCQVIGVDLDKRRLDLAHLLGAISCFKPDEIDLQKKIENITSSYGVDATIVTAATPSDEPINQAMLITRKKGIVVIVGNVGLSLERSPFYEKEIDLKISCSYGPGRYDQNYEIKGLDYPYPYVRWTENRNMRAYLDLLASGKINFGKIVEAEYDLTNAPQAYERLINTVNKPLAILLKYPTSQSDFHEHKLEITPIRKPIKGLIGVGIIGAGNFVTQFHLPHLAKLNKYYEIKAIADRDGVKAKKVGQKHQVGYVTTDYQDILTDRNIDLILITTRHDSHVSLAKESLAAGKAVFVEKPMAMNQKELNELVELIKNKNLPFMVGFNRRFSPLAKRVRELTEARKNPLIIYYRMNAGYLPPDHWVYGEEGGGRIIGEACHIFDLFNFWTASPPLNLKVTSIKPKSDNISYHDNIVCILEYRDGSVANLIYTSLGSNNLTKEYSEIYFDGNTLILDDYVSLKNCETGELIKNKLQDKGHLQELVEFGDFLRGIVKKPPLSLEEMINTTETSFRIKEINK